MDDRSLILEAEVRRRAALVAVDIAALDALFSDELVHVHSTGTVHDKKALLAHIGKNRAFTAIERGPLNVQLYGEVAVMTGPMTNYMRRQDGTERVLNGMVTQVLKREAGAWRFTNFQLTPSSGV
jgi:ketosteroid isomerase-like protein